MLQALENGKETSLLLQFLLQVRLLVLVLVVQVLLFLLLLLYMSDSLVQV